MENYYGKNQCPTHGSGEDTSRYHLDTGQSHQGPDGQAERPARSEPARVLNLSVSGILSLVMVFCLLFTLIPVSAVRVLAAEAVEVQIGSWDELVTQYQDGEVDGVTNLVIPEDKIIRTKEPLLVGNGKFNIMGGGTIYADFQHDGAGQLEFTKMTLKPISSEYPYVLENKSGNAFISGASESEDPTESTIVEGQIKNEGTMIISGCIITKNEEYNIQGEFLNNGSLIINGYGVMRIYGKLVNNSSCTYNGGAIREIENNGTIHINAEVGNVDLSDGNQLGDGFFTTITNTGELYSNEDCTYYNCHIVNEEGNDARFTIEGSKSTPYEGKGCLITNKGVTSIKSGDFHDITIENTSILSIEDGTFYHAKIVSKSTTGSFVIGGGTFTGESEEPYSGTQIRCESGSISFGTFDVEETHQITDVPKIINNQCKYASPVYIGESAMAFFNVVTIENNSSEQDGGAIYNEGTANFLGMNGDITIRKNTSSGAGGAIYNKGIAQILDATGCIKIQKNTSNGKGGAICNENEGQLTLVGCTITGNTGDMAGGVYSSNPITIGLETNITGNKGNDENQEQNVYSASMVAGDYAFEIKPDLSPLSIKASIGLTGASDGGKVVKIVPYSGIEFEDDDVSKIFFDDAHQCVAARSENNDFVQFVLRPIIHGKVTVGGTDVPETILNINLYDEDDNGFCLSNGTTLSDGTYSFSDVTPDLSHKLRIELVEIEKKGYSCADNPKILAAGTVNKETCEVNFDLKKLTGNIEGYVYMEDTHKPVSGATVTLMPE